MVMLVTNSALQETLDQWDHMFRFGLNVPLYFLVHDHGSLIDFKNEWCHGRERARVYKYLRDSDDEPNKNLVTDVPSLSKIHEDQVDEFYFLAMPYIDEPDFKFAGFVKSPEPDAYEMTVGYNRNHRIPFDTDDVDFLVNCDSRDKIPQLEHWTSDLIRRAAISFPYPGVRLTWTITGSRVGRIKQELCFWDYQVDPSFIRE